MISTHVKAREQCTVEPPATLGEQHFSRYIGVAAIEGFHCI